MNSTTPSRPRDLQDLVQEESLAAETTSSTFNLDNLSDSEEIWMMDIPRTIDPKELTGQTLALGNKSKFRIGEEKYCAVKHDMKCNVTCVFNTGKVKSRYKAVNVKLAGSLAIRRKLSNVSKVKPVSLEDVGVPFPENLKVRHPLFGAISEAQCRKETNALRHTGKRKDRKVEA